MNYDVTAYRSSRLFDLPLIMQQQWHINMNTAFIRQIYNDRQALNRKSYFAVTLDILPRNSET
jgi:hypothetical protein